MLRCCDLDDRLRRRRPADERRSGRADVPPRHAKLLRPVEDETAAGQAAGPDVAATPARTRAPVQGFAWLETLWATIDARASADPSASYTARLLAAGVDGPARKVAEEATEVLMAAKDDAVASAEARPATRDAADRRSRGPALPHPGAAPRTRPGAGGGHRLTCASATSPEAGVAPGFARSPGPQAGGAGPSALQPPDPQPLLAHSDDQIPTGDRRRNGGLGCRQALVVDREAALGDRPARIAVRGEQAARDRQSKSAAGSRLRQ